MKKLVLGVALVALTAGAAAAADIGAKPYTKAPMMAASGYNWSGFYVGGQVGAASLSSQFKDDFDFLIMKA